MHNFKIYDLLPNGVIVFKNKTILYMNKHILDIMNLTDLAQENAIEIMAETLNIRSVDGLFSFFSANEYFRHNEKVIQIAQNSYDDLELFSFMRINHSLILEPKTIEATESQKKVLAVNIDAKVASFFQLNNIRKIKVLTLYKGLPLKNFGKIIKVTHAFIDVEVDNKHMISLLESKSVLLISNEKDGSSVLKGEVISHENNIFRIKNFFVSKEEMHQREEIRVKPNKQLSINDQSREFKVYDISIKGISIAIESEEDETFLKNKQSIYLLLKNETLTLEVEYLKSIFVEERLVKLIFLIIPDAYGTSIIQHYITSRQQEIIREIHQYLRDCK